jgi:serine/threonine protein phosphatase PrpC
MPSLRNKNKKVAAASIEALEPPVFNPVQQIAQADVARDHKKILKHCGAWSIGTASKTGNVRTENQDACLGFQSNEHDVVLVADGCGGLPYGGKAASLAVSCAKASILAALQADKITSLRAITLRAVLKAARGLIEEGRSMGICEINGGLRTTLIVIVADKKEIAYSYIGDGGGLVLKTSGEIKKFLVPQKASETALNILAASLGPILQGWPKHGTIPRGDGDLIITGTDGIFDRVPNFQTFAKDVLSYCIRNAGDLEKAADLVTEEMISYQDHLGYVCDDNVSLGLIGDGCQPVLSPDFWNYL